jgi:hypothetical protein
VRADEDVAGVLCCASPESLFSCLVSGIEMQIDNKAGAGSWSRGGRTLSGGEARSGRLRSEVRACSKGSRNGRLRGSR